MISAPQKYSTLVLPVVLGLIVLFIPLLRDFHLESALLAALAGCFWAGWKANQRAPETSDARQALSVLGYLYLFGLPLLGYALVTGCFSMHGLGFWLLYPVPGVFFGYSVGRLFRIWSVPLGRILTILILLVIAVGGLLIEFYSFPQVYFFNHVWGGWPGPIYDETVQITGSLLYFRFLTVLWILLLWFIPDFHSGKKANGIVIFSLAALLLSYISLSKAGVITPGWYIQKQLGGVKETGHFKIYFAGSYYSDDDINRLALEHEFYLDEITRQLQVTKPDSTHKIESYLYAHPWQKKKLVGAKFTSYVPVWLEQDQLHIAKQQLNGSLKHELVHVLAKQFGNKLFNASWSIGLIEGLAVAVSPDESRTTTIDQIVVSEKPLPHAKEMRQALSPLGFYGGRSAVNYTTSGSFVRYLLAAYPVSNFKQAYKTGSIAKAYPVSFEELVQGWHQHLDTVEVDSVDERVARRLFGLPSLFEQQCPHILSDIAFTLDQYRFYLAEKDTLKIIQSLDRALELRPDELSLKTEWTYQNLKAGHADKVKQRAALQDTTLDLQLLYADAFALSGDYREAQKYLNKGAGLLKAEPDSASEIALETRMDSIQWKRYRELAYHNKLFEAEVFKQLLYRTKVRTVQQAIDREQWDRLRAYSKILYELPADARYMDAYLSMIHLLGYLQEWNLAEKWITKLNAMKVRQRYTERLQQESRWIAYLKSNET